MNPHSTADRTRLLAILLMIGAGVSFAIMSALMKVAGERLSTFEVVFGRGLVGFLLVVSLERLGAGERTRAINRGGLVVRALFGFLAMTTYVWAVNHIDLGLASALNQSSPLFVALFAVLFLKERPQKLLPVLVFFGFVGVWLIVAPDFSTINIHAVVGATSAVLAAMSYIMVRHLRRTDRPWVIVRWFTLLNALFALPFLLVGNWLWPTPLEWAALAGIGAMGLAGQLLLTHSYRLAEASVVSPFIYTCVLVNFLAGWLFWDEWPTALAFLGGVLLVASSLAIAILARQKKDPSMETVSP